MKLYYNIVLTIIRMTYISQGFLLNHKILYNYITTARIVILVLLIYGVGIMYRIYTYTPFLKIQTRAFIIHTRSNIIALFGV